jgi:hypothetical protein
MLLQPCRSSLLFSLVFLTSSTCSPEPDTVSSMLPRKAHPRSFIASNVSTLKQIIKEEDEKQFTSSLDIFPEAPEAESKEKTWCMGPELTITSPYCPLQSRLHYIYHGQPYARVDFIPQSGTSDFASAVGGLRMEYSRALPSSPLIYFKANPWIFHLKTT